MDQRQFEAAVAHHQPPLNILSLAFCGSALLYVGLGWLLTAVLDMPPLLELPLAVATGVAASQLIVLLAGYLISRAIRNAGETTAGSGGAPGAVDAALRRYARSVIVGAAFREMVAVVGLVLTLFTGEVLWVALLAAIAIVSMLVHWPRRDAMIDYLQQQKQAR